jgi:hypothetical protein
LINDNILEAQAVSTTRTDLLSITRTLLRWGFYVDIGLLALLVAVGAALMLGDGSRIHLTGAEGMTPEQKLVATRIAVAGGIVCSALTLPVLRWLLGIVDSTRAGDPFVPDNGLRLRRIGWAMLAISILAHMMETAVTRGYVGIPRPTFAGLMTVLMVFVLARIFETGSLMRAELKDTI